MKALFIGGTVNGEWREVEDDLPTKIEMVHDEDETRISVYVRRDLAALNAPPSERKGHVEPHVFAVYLLAGTPIDELFQALFQGYHLCLHPNRETE